MSAPANAGRFWVVVPGSQRITMRHKQADALAEAERLATVARRFVVLVDTHIAVSERVYPRDVK